jgi:drug/metabolite transporter (DMT)-like permease
MPDASHKPAIAWQGVLIAFSAPVFLGMAPVLGKLALGGGADAFTVAALRTLVAVGILWIVYALFFRRYIYIYPAGLMGCAVIGTINGIGSLFYYSGLTLLDASMVQLINGTYVVFALLIASFAGHQFSRHTMLRVGLALMGLVLITGLSAQPVNFAGFGLMLANALMFAGTVVLSQYVLYEMPAPTVALYVLTTMAILVSVVWLAIGEPLTEAVIAASLGPIALLGITTALSRLTIFAGVKVLGGLQTAILAISETAVALVLSFLVLGDSLSVGQWVGVVLLFTSILIVRQRDLLPHGVNPNLLLTANMASVQFQRIAFHRAFGTGEVDNAEQTMASLSPAELEAIRRMMGAETGIIDPFPIKQKRT